MNNDTFINEFFTRKDFRLGRFKDGRRHGNLQMDKHALYSYGTHFPLAVETHFDQYLLNGDSYSSSTSSHQHTVRWAVPSDAMHAEVPFSALSELFVRDGYHVDRWRSPSVRLVKMVKILDKTDAEYRTIKYKDPKTGEEKEREEHMLGATLICFNGRYLLSGTDPSAHWRFGYFMSELPYPVGNVEEAFNALMPIEVMEAEEEGKQWLRHGEWFFIEEGKIYSFRKKFRDIFDKASKSIEGYDESCLLLINQYKMKPSEADDLLRAFITQKLQRRLPGFPEAQATFSVDAFMQKNVALPAHNGQDIGHHQVTRLLTTPDGEMYCRGTVRHTRNEHRMLKLGKGSWFRAVANAQIAAWGASGRID